MLKHILCAVQIQRNQPPSVFLVTFIPWWTLSIIPDIKEEYCFITLKTSLFTRSGLATVTLTSLLQWICGLSNFIAITFQFVKFVKCRQSTPAFNSKDHIQAQKWNEKGKIWFSHTNEFFFVRIPKIRIQIQKKIHLLKLTKWARQNKREEVWKNSFNFICEVFFAVVVLVA